MKKTLLLLALAVLATPVLRASDKKPLPKDLPPFGEDKPLPVPPIAQSKLANGLIVWVVKRGGYPRATVKLAVRGGAAADPKEAPGHLGPPGRHPEGGDDHEDLATDRGAAPDRRRRHRRQRRLRCDLPHRHRPRIGRVPDARDGGRHRAEPHLPRRRGRAGQGQRDRGAEGPGIDARVPGPEGAGPGRLRRSPVPDRGRHRRRRCKPRPWTSSRRSTCVGSGPTARCSWSWAT